MKKFNQLNNRGLTLIELLLALSLVSMVVTVVFSMFMVGARAYGKGNTQAELQYEVRRTTNKIVDELRKATSISATTGDEEIDINTSINPEYTSVFKYSVTGNILNVYIKASEGSLSFDLTTEVLLDNNTSGDIAENSSGKIYYNLPENDNFEPTYSVFQSSDATLSNLVPDDGTLSPVFDSSITNYNVSLPLGSAGEVNVIATTNDPNAVISPANPKANNVTGDLSDRTASVRVTSEDGNHIKTYEIVFTVATTGNPVTHIEFDNPSITLIKNTSIVLSDLLSVEPNDLNPVPVTFTILEPDPNATIVFDTLWTLWTGNQETITVLAETTDGTELSCELIVNVVNN